MKLLLLLTIVVIIQSKIQNLEQALYNGQLYLTTNIAKQIFLNYKHEKHLDELFPIFYPNLEKIVNHNLDKSKTWIMGVNDFAFMTDEEFNDNFLGASPQNCSATTQYTANKPRVELDYADIPSSYNWTAQNKVSPVKDQRHCGSCWTFGATGALESHWAIIFDTFPPYFSEQQLVDCAQDFDNHGCNGGLPSQAFEYIYYNGGISFENSYPYVGMDGNKCRYNPNQKGAYVRGGSFNITFQDENQLLQQVANAGPVAVAFQVQGDFKFYKSGVYSDPNCSTEPDKVNHAVLAAGYGTQDGTDYWYIKNSWSTVWGDNGYFLMERGVNMCGVADCASYPIVKG